MIVIPIWAQLGVGCNERMKRMAVKWNSEQVKQLELTFPELTCTSNANDLLVNAGRREVVLYIKSQLRKQQQPDTTSHIPEDILYGE